MKTRMTVQEWLDHESFSSDEEFIAWLQSEMMDSIVPALCTEGCEVEPDGHCVHENPSILIEMGII